MTPYTRGSVSLSLSLSIPHEGQAGRLGPHFTRGSVSLALYLSLTGGRAETWCLLIHADLYLSLTGGRAETWCLLIHAEASISVSHFEPSLIKLYEAGFADNFPRGGSSRERAVAAGGDTLARPLRGAVDRAGSAGAIFRTRAR